MQHVCRCFHSWKTSKPLSLLLLPLILKVFIIFFFFFCPSAEDLKSDSVSAGDIVEFLKEFSKDLTSEVKSEIREASNAVDEFISPDCTNSRQQENDKRNTKLYNCQTLHRVRLNSS